MQQYDALSSGDKWRIARRLTQGKAPDDPRMAAAAIELAESYRHQGRVYGALVRWLPVMMAVVLSATVISGADDGDLEMVILLVLIGLGSAGHLTPNVQPGAATKKCGSIFGSIETGR